MDIEAPTSLPWKLFLFILLVLLLIGALVALASVNLAGTRSTTSQCPGFDEQAEAFQLAQFAEQYRKSHPLPVNYGLGSWTICYAQEPPIRYQTPVFKGSNNPDTKVGPKQLTHSEQQTYRFLQYKLTSASLDRSKMVAIEVVIFSQVIVCLPCQSDMPSWESVLRKITRTDLLFLSIWDIARGRGFAPTVYPGGTGIPVTIDDLEQVPIQFTP